MGNPSATNYQSNLCFDKTLTILDGQTASNAIDLIGTYLVALIIPTGFDGSTLAIQGAASLDGTYYNAYNTSGTQLVPVVAASRYIPFVPSDTASIRFLKLIAGTSQTGDITITLVTRPLA
jgi:hypothetical protein